MLSPIMMTNVNGNAAWYSAIRSATWYWPRSPVPLSPMTARRTESGSSGSLRSSCWAEPAPPSKRSAARTQLRGRMSSIGSTNRARALKRRDGHHDATDSWLKTGYGIFDEIDDQIGVGVAQNQGLAEEPVFELWRQRRQL